MSCSIETSRSTHLGQRIAGGVALIALSLILALAGCDKAQEPPPPDKPAIDINAPGVDIEINKPQDADSEH